ncbi:MAG: alanine:cation symporter family protein [Bacteroidales bacterium]|nr:alanine:cation symporter family protein [Bacteroidales bacterium]
MHIIDSINNIFWGYFLIAALLGCALWFTIKTKGVQFRCFHDMFRLLIKSPMSAQTLTGEVDKLGRPKKTHISSFEAFMISLAGRIGTGNLAGVASAIAIGGPGAVFWMWTIAIFGAATSFVECTLAQLFKVKHDGSFIGGPAYYMRDGLGKKWMGVLFSFLIIITFAFSQSSVQSNTMCAALNHAFGFNPTIVGIVLLVLTLIIVFGGLKRIATVSSMVVPFMAFCYLFIAIIVIAINIKALPGAIKLIFESAFGFKQAMGGMFGAAIMQGIKRGLFSNEAGEGSSPNAAAAAETKHPVNQGLIQALGVFTDTLLICTCTAFIILCSDVPWNCGLDGVNLTQEALSSTIGNAGSVIIAITLCFFAYSSILANYYFGEANIKFVTGSKTALNIYRVAVSGMVLFGALSSLSTVWAITDITMALMTTCNLVAVVQLAKYAFKLLDNYTAQRKRGVKYPKFHRSDLPEIEDKITCWE